MKLREALANSNHKTVKIALVATLAAGALVWTLGSNDGELPFSQSGLKDSSQSSLKNSIFRTKDLAARALEDTSDALNSFIGRSPGERGATDILKGKSQRFAQRSGKASNRARPKQRALGKVFDKPAQDIAGGLPPQPLADLLMAAGELGDTIPALAPVAAIVPDVVAPIGGGFGGGPSFGGGPGFGGGFVGGIGGGNVPPVIAPPVTGTPVVPPVASAIPEPSTWLLLLLGFGAIGASLRRSKLATLRTGHCAAI